MPPVSTALVVSDAASPPTHVVPFNRSFFEFNAASLEEGGVIVSSCKQAMKISGEEFSAFYQSTSDAKWASYVRATNLMFLKASEGTYPYALFAIEGFDFSKLVCNPIPLEVATKLIPKLYEDTKRDPEGNGLKMKDIEDSKIKRNQARIDVLKWKPSDCQSTANKQKVMKPCKPNPSAKNPKQMSKY